MPDDKPVTLEICEFMDNCPFDGFIEKIKNSQISFDDFIHIETTIAKVKLQESKLRQLRQQIEYQARKHRLDEFRERV